MKKLKKAKLVSILVKEALEMFKNCGRTEEAIICLRYLDKKKEIKDILDKELPSEMAADAYFSIKEYK